MKRILKQYYSFKLKKQWHEISECIAHGIILSFFSGFCDNKTLTWVKKKTQIQEKKGFLCTVIHIF